MGQHMTHGPLPRIFWLSLTVSACLILTQTLEAPLAEVLTPFFLPLVQLAFAGAFLVVVGWTLLHAVLRFRQNAFRAVAPLALNALALTLVLFVPLGWFLVDWDFRSTANERTEVVDMIESGQLQPNVPHNGKLIMLPGKYAHLSRGGGEVVVERYGATVTVLFYISRGILGNYSGYVFRSDDSAPSWRDLDGDLKRVVRLRQYWFWGSSR